MLSAYENALNAAERDEFAKLVTRFSDALRLVS